MKVKIRSFAGFRHILGRENEVELAQGASIKDLLDALCTAHGELGPLVCKRYSRRKEYRSSARHANEAGRRK
jgi:molybdopterin converting factor small subunit